LYFFKTVNELDYSVH